MNFLKLRINKPIGPYAIGSVVKVECNKSGVPVNRQWRRRLADSVYDGCVGKVESVKPKKTSKIKQ